MGTRSQSRAIGPRPRRPLDRSDRSARRRGAAMAGRRRVPRGHDRAAVPRPHLLSWAGVHPIRRRALRQSGAGRRRPVADARQSLALPACAGDRQRRPPALAGVLDRLVLPTLLCAPMLERARADLPETPSSFRSASTVAWSSMSDQPSWVPRSSECATWDADAEDAWPGCSLAAWALGAALLPVLAWRRNCWMDEDDGDGGRCEKSEL